jgi:hypothetical protein
MWDTGGTRRRLRKMAVKALVVFGGLLVLAGHEETAQVAFTVLALFLVVFLPLPILSGLFSPAWVLPRGFPPTRFMVLGVYGMLAAAIILVMALMRVSMGDLPVLPRSHVLMIYEKLGPAFWMIQVGLVLTVLLGLLNPRKVVPPFLPPTRMVVLMGGTLLFAFLLGLASLALAVQPVLLG